MHFAAFELLRVGTKRMYSNAQTLFHGGERSTDDIVLERRPLQIIP